jgi:hypothetical protein
MATKTTKEVVSNTGQPASNLPEIPRPSFPYSVRVKNTSDSVQKVKLFDIDTLYERDYGNPHVRIEGTTGITYRELVMQLIAQPVTIGETYIQDVNTALPGSPLLNKYLSTFHIQSKDAAGIRIIIPVHCLKDPYQMQNDVRVNNTEYKLGVLTTIEFELPGNSEVCYDFYPKVKVDLKMKLDNKDIVKEYGPSNTIKQPPAPYSFPGPISTVSNQTLAAIKEAVREVLNEKKKPVRRIPPKRTTQKKAA